MTNGDALNSNRAHRYQYYILLPQPSIINADCKIIRPSVFIVFSLSLLESTLLNKLGASRMTALQNPKLVVARHNLHIAFPLASHTLYPEPLMQLLSITI